VYLKFIKRIAFFISVLALTAGMYFVYWSSGVRPVTVVYTSDGHGNILPVNMEVQGKSEAAGGLMKFKSFISGLDKPYILLDSGNMLHGAPEAVVTQGRMVVDIKNTLGYDACALGSYDFLYGRDILESLINSAEFPFLAANIFDEESESASGLLREPAFMEIGGVKVGVAGLVSPYAQNHIPAEKMGGLKQRDWQESAIRAAEKMSGEGADIRILLSNGGIEHDKNISEKIEGIDVILGGQPNEKMRDAAIFNGVLLGHSGYEYAHPGKLTLFYCSRQNKILSYTNKFEFISGEKYSESTEIKARLEEENIQDDFWEEIGVSENYMPNYTVGEGVKHGELSIGNWQTDLMREKMGADLAFQSPHRIRASIPKGRIKLRDIWSVSPFNDRIVKMELTGKQIREILEISLSERYSIMQVSGMQVLYNDSLPEGNRLLNVILEDEDGRKRELREDESLKVAVTAYLSKGPGGYGHFSDADVIEESSEGFRDLQIEYIKNNRSINAVKEGRLVNVRL